MTGSREKVKLNFKVVFTVDFYWLLIMIHLQY